MKKNKLNIIFTTEEIKILCLKRKKYYYIINKTVKKAKKIIKR